MKTHLVALSLGILVWAATADANYTAVVSVDRLPGTRSLTVLVDAQGGTITCTDTAPCRIDLVLEWETAPGDRLTNWQGLGAFGFEPVDVYFSPEPGPCAWLNAASCQTAWFSLTDRYSLDPSGPVMMFSVDVVPDGTGVARIALIDASCTNADVLIDAPSAVQEVPLLVTAFDMVDKNRLGWSTAIAPTTDYDVEMVDDTGAWSVIGTVAQAGVGDYTFRAPCGTQVYRLAEGGAHSAELTATRACKGHGKKH